MRGSIPLSSAKLIKKRNIKTENMSDNKYDLHIEAVELMKKLDKKYNRETIMSLDEYFCEYEFTDEESDEIYSLLKRF